MRTRAVCIALFRRSRPYFRTPISSLTTTASGSASRSRARFVPFIADGIYIPVGTTEAFLAPRRIGLSYRICHLPSVCAHTDAPLLGERRRLAGVVRGRQRAQRCVQECVIQASCPPRDGFFLCLDVLSVSASASLSSLISGNHLTPTLKAGYASTVSLRTGALPARWPSAWPARVQKEIHHVSVSLCPDAPFEQVHQHLLTPVCGSCVGVRHCRFLCPPEARCLTDNYG